MTDATLLSDAIIALATLAGLVVIARAALRGWDGWLALKRLELERAGQARRGDAAGSGVGLGAGLIELADLRERLRKLEAIAAGVDP